MSKYKKVIASNGVEMFYEDGTRVKPDSLPAGLASRLQDGIEVEIAAGHADPKEGEEGEDTKLDEKVKEELGEETVVEDEEKPDIPTDVCFLDGAPARYKKFLQLKTVGMCEEHYRTMTTGEVVAAMREKEIID